MVGLGFYAEVEKAGFAHLGEAMDSAPRRAELLALLDRLFATNTRDHWVAKLRAADIVSAPINTMLEAAADPDVLANGYVTEVDYAKYGKRLRVHGSPWQFSETPAKAGIAPELGEHNAEVLASLGYSEADIQGLRARKVI
jgi:crotonobetainyl-CoA:carnitine CoA-transferase CaiB-like acyl-CoA transferase